MKRQVQKTGVRKYFGADLVELQSEPLAALDAFFAEYGPCVVQGCEITETPDGSGTYNVAAGLVALTGTDTEGVQRVMVMPFAGAAGVALPLYLTAQAQVVERVYGDGKVKPIAHAYTAQAIGVDPGAEVPHLTLTAAGGNRFVDAVQDAGHRFISDAERSQWNRILEQAKEYADGVAATGSEAALRSAKEYTDARETAILAEVDNKAAATLRTFKDYTDTSIDALLDGAPETMNTIREVADELKKHKDTATAMMQVIGEKATKEEVNAALAEKAGKDHYHGHLVPSYSGSVVEPPHHFNRSIGLKVAMFGNLGLGSSYVDAVWINGYSGLDVPNCHALLFPRDGSNEMYLTVQSTEALAFGAAKRVWHSGNFDPASCIQNQGMRADISQEMIGTGFQYDTGGSGTQGPFIAFGSPKYAAQMVCGYWAGNGGHQNLKFRTRNGDTGVWNPWFTVYCDGNLGPATAASAGLMSAADKAKLDGIGEGGMKLLGAGVVDGAGQLQKKNGLVTHAIRSGGTGYFRVFHTVGHTNYEVQATCVQYNNSNGYVSIRAKTASYFDVWTADDDSVNDVSFFFQIYEF